MFKWFGEIRQLLQTIAKRLEHIDARLRMLEQTVGTDDKADGNLFIRTGPRRPQS